ncbi:MAG: putative selenoprotein [Acidobacteria bacterium]|nr:putative selenoprotein [Acidobacteriota bacterium]
MLRLMRQFWRGVRDWCGDSAYERYLSATQRRHSQDSPLTQDEFYVEQLQRRYSRPNRCC